MLLAGDIGGTKTRLGLFAAGSHRPTAEYTSEFITLDFSSLDAMVDEFLRGCEEREPTLQAACFGVAGPVRERTAQLTNVPWTIDAMALAERFAIGRVKLLNDLEAMAHSVSVLEPSELAVLQDGKAVNTGHAALIAAGTGLGEAFLHNVGGHFVPAASEGGHADFSARTPRELELVRELTQSLGRVRCEDVISGPGLVNLHRFVHRTPCPVVDSAVDPDQLPKHISTSALKRRCTKCVETLDMFVAAYGAEAGNLALRSVALAGVYLGGGIAPRILPALESKTFTEAFRAKPPMTALLAAMPVMVILNPQPGLLGAASYANEMI